MTRLITRTVLLCCLSLIPFSLFAQRLNSFSEDVPTFQKELESFVTANKNSELEEIWKTFKDEIVKTGAFDAEQWSQVRQTGDTMLDRRMSSYPYFALYLETLLGIQQSTNPTAQFDQWHNLYQQVLSDIDALRLTGIKSFLEFSRNYYLERALRYNKLGATWYASSTLPDEMTYQSGELKLDFGQTDLTVNRLGDSISIQGTAGTFYALDNRWEGRGGKVNWSRYGRPDIAVTLEEYTIDMTKSGYEARQVALSYPDYFPNKTIAGQFEDKATALKDSAQTGSYPRFLSRDSLLQVQNIGEGISFQGGVRLQGTTVYGIGSRRLPAQIEIFDQRGQKVFRGLSRNFAIQQGERIASKDVSSTLYFGNDSLFHPSLIMRYKIRERTFNLQRNAEGSGRNPFFDSYHQVNIKAESMDWIVGTDSLIVGKQSIGFNEEVGQAVFESLDFFNEGDYRRLQNIGSYNPIATFARVAREQGQENLQAELLAQELNPRFNQTSIQSLLFDMTEEGFVEYDSETGRVNIKDKTLHYAKASLGRSDYDVLRILSDAGNKTNARLNIPTGDFIINDVRNIEFSPLQRVAIVPAGDQIILQQNRDMDFAGRLYAGYGLFQGKDFHFEYDPFHIVMDSVRYLDLYVPTGKLDRDGNPVALSLASRIEHLSGTLLIDAPNNKSGQKDIPLFPAFNSQSPAYVYYGDSSIQEGAYARDSFYFQLNPFNFNSLDDFTAADVAFDGNLSSADIFPEIPEVLEIQEDQSLGIQTETPEEGFPVYRGKGQFTGLLDLNHQGLLGQGNLSYLGTSIYSDTFTWRPSQMLCAADEFILEEDRDDPEFPYAYGVDVDINWLPYKDSMYIRSEEKPFEMFSEKGYWLEGTLILTPNDLRADGELDWPDGTLTARDMGMGAFSVQSDTARIAIKALENQEEIAVSNDSVQAFIDFDRKEGNFTSHAGKAVTELPYNLFQTSMDAFDWNMEGKAVTFINSGVDLSNFLSVHPDKDSLRFQGNAASYDLESSTLNIGGVPYILSCDALIYPDSGKVTVLKGGDLDSLSNARIVASVENKNHVINRASLQINGRKSFSGRGYYEYNVGPHQQEILFDDIVGSRVGKGKRSEKPTETRATGEIMEEDSFYIDHKTQFAGTISLNSTSKALEFEGFARLDVPELPERDWFSLESEGDKADLTIQFDLPKTYDGEDVRAGIYLSKETAEVYPRIMQPLYFRKDRAILDTRGVFKYDEDQRRFLFGDSSKVQGNGKTGNFMVYSLASNSINAEGRMNLGSGLGYVSMDAAGKLATQFVDPTDLSAPQDSMGFDSLAIPGPRSLTEAIEIDIIAGVSFYLPENLLNLILSDLNASTFGAQRVNHIPLPFYEKALAELIAEPKVLSQVINDLKVANDLNIPQKQNPYTLLFSKLPMKWNPDYQSWFSTDDQLGFASIKGVPVNLLLKAYVECKMPTNEDDRLYIYFETPDGYFYFFGYKQGIMNTVSNNTTYNDLVLGLKKKEAVIKMGDGGLYEIQLVDQGSARAFVNRVKDGRK